MVAGRLRGLRQAPIRIQVGVCSIVGPVFLTVFIIVKDAKSRVAVEPLCGDALQRDLYEPGSSATANFIKLIRASGGFCTWHRTTLSTYTGFGLKGWSAAPKKGICSSG